MRIRVRELANGEYVAEVRGLFGWYLITRDFDSQGDVARELSGIDNTNKRMIATKNYAYGLRYGEGAKKGHLEARSWGRDYAASRGCSPLDIDWVTEQP